MELVKKVEAVLKEVFPPPDKITLDDDKYGISGSVASERFVGMETLDRVRLMRKTLSEGLTPEERRRVVLIVAITPYEEIAHTS